MTAILLVNLRKIRVIILRAKTTLLVHNLLRPTEIQQFTIISRLISPILLVPLTTLQLAIPSPFLTHLVQLTPKIIFHRIRNPTHKILLIHKITLVLRRCLMVIHFLRVILWHIMHHFLLYNAIFDQTT